MLLSWVACEHDSEPQLDAVHLALFDVCGIPRAEDLRGILQKWDIECLCSACRPHPCMASWRHATVHKYTVSNIIESIND